MAILSAILLIFAFPDFEFWFLAFFGLVPLLFAIELEKESFIKAFLTGWLFGIIFFFGTCWWLTFAPITYAKVPAVLAYFLLLCACIVVGFYPALFGGILSSFLKRFGHWGFLSAPFLWTAIEFLRLWTTGNNWNAIGYSQAFGSPIVGYAKIGGVFLISFFVVFSNAIIFLQKDYVHKLITTNDYVARKIDQKISERRYNLLIIIIIVSLFVITGLVSNFSVNKVFLEQKRFPSARVVAVQPNVPMSGLNREKWRKLREQQIIQAEKSIDRVRSLDFVSKDVIPTAVILPESPMNFQYEEDPEFRAYINNFAKRNNVSVLFNSAEPDKRREYGYFNSAVLINEKGEKVIQYDKIHLLPFGEFVPLPEPIEWIVPTMVGRFSHGEEYDLLPFGDAKAGVMICFESHFPSLSREYVRNGADVLVEMTNDGYLGNTPVLRQHLASAVFRAVETNRPVLRVTNVGVTAYINERGEILDEAPVYQEDTKIWSISKSDGKQTIYVKYGEWFAWLCSIVSLVLLFISFRKRK